ncbi:MAG: M14 family murein peptide amidase A [Proteobacteria bacterium]|nr:M14 family murein peptide amidase A [Pseudomonadota bacterium]
MELTSLSRKKDIFGVVLIKIFLFILLPLSLVQAEDNENLVAQECNRIGNKLGSVSINNCLDINLTATDGRSVKNAPILLKEYPPLTRRSPLGKILLLGGIHGDEYSSVSIVFKWMRILNEHHSGLFHWHIVPLLNPDGLLRKKSQRMNENNVDLNRNFSMHDWENTAIKHWIDVTHSNPRRYPGEKPLSEPETTWLVEHINRYDPDVIVAVHAPHGVVDYDGPCNGPYKLGRLYLNLLGTYPGSLGNYAGIQRKIPVVTIELPYAGIMPTNKEINDIWRDMVKWLSKNITLEVYTKLLEKIQDTAPS